MHCSTNTPPLTDMERERFDDLTTTRTSFTAGKPASNLYQFPAVPLALVFQHPYELRPESADSEGAGLATSSRRGAREL
jgi:hypothetical protein